MLLCSQRTGNIMTHTHHIPALIVQAHHRRFVSSALRVQRRGLFLGVSDAPGLFAVPQLKPGAYNRLVVPAHACGSGQGRCTVIASYLGPALLSCHAEKRLIIPCLNRPAFLRLD